MLHTSVGGGDRDERPTRCRFSLLGAYLERDEGGRRLGGAARLSQRPGPASRQAFAAGAPTASVARRRDRGCERALTLEAVHVNG